MFYKHFCPFYAVTYLLSSIAYYCGNILLHRAADHIKARILLDFNAATDADTAATDAHTVSNRPRATATSTVPTVLDVLQP